MKKGVFQGSPVHEFSDFKLRFTDLFLTTIYRHSEHLDVGFLIHESRTIFWKVRTPHSTYTNYPQIRHLTYDIFFLILFVLVQIDNYIMLSNLDSNYYIASSSQTISYNFLTTSFLFFFQSPYFSLSLVVLSFAHLFSQLLQNGKYQHVRKCGNSLAYLKSLGYSFLLLIHVQQDPIKRCKADNQKFTIIVEILTKNDLKVGTLWYDVPFLLIHF